MSIQQEIDDLLNLLSPEVRERVRADERFAPVVALLAALKAAVYGHVGRLHSAVVESILSEIMPRGDWYFPAQTVAVPEEPKSREIQITTRFTEGANVWTPCGPGWTRPTFIESVNVYSEPDPYGCLDFVIAYQPAKAGTPLLQVQSDPLQNTPEHQLAFVKAAASVVEALARCRWLIFDVDSERPKPVRAERYEGYLDFERAVGASLASQKHLQLWLPPFHPYSRKFLRFRLEPDPAEGEIPYPALVRQTGMVHLVCILDENAREQVSTYDVGDLLHLNAVPLAQMQTRLLAAAVEFRHGDRTIVPLAGARRVAAAGASIIVEVEGIPRVNYLPASLSLRAPADPLQRDPLRVDVEISCDNTDGAPGSIQMRLYDECNGELTSQPTQLQRPDSPFTAIAPAVGGESLSLASWESSGTRRIWHEMFLRAPVPSPGDIIEILSQRTDLRRHFETESMAFVLDVSNAASSGLSPWRNYLWPTIVRSPSDVDGYLRDSYSDSVPIVPILRVLLTPRPSSAPSWLLADMADYAASLASRYMALACYRVEGQVMDL